MQCIINGFNADYEVEAGNTRLLLTKDNLNNQEIIKFQVEMINNNQIPGILKLSLNQKDLDYKFYYNLTGKVTLANYLRRQKVNKYQFLNLIDGILKTILASKSYFLDPNSFILDENFIYLDALGQQVQLIYLPLPIKQNIIPTFKNFLSDLIINSVNLETSDNFIQEILRLMKTEEINLLDISNEIQKLKNNDNVQHNQDNSVGGIQTVINTNNPASSYHDPGNNSESIFSFEDDFSDKPPSRFIIKPNLRKIVLGSLAIISVIAAFLSTQEGGLTGVSQKVNGLKFIVLGGSLIVFGLGIIFFILIKPKQQKQYEQEFEFNESLTNLENPTPKLANPRLFSTYATESIAATSHAVIPNKSSKTKVTLFQHEEELAEEVTNETNSNETNLIEGTFNEPTFNESTSQRDETVLLTDTVVPMLKAVRGGEIIIINQPEFIIGRNGDTCNYCVKEPSLGRAHVKLQKIHDTFYVTDLDSKNGTFLNGQRLISNKPYLLQNNDQLKLANFELIFQV